MNFFKKIIKHIDCLRRLFWDKNIIAVFAAIIKELRFNILVPLYSYLSLQIVKFKDRVLVLFKKFFLTIFKFIKNISSTLANMLRFTKNYFIKILKSSIAYASKWLKGETSLVANSAIVVFVKNSKKYKMIIFYTDKFRNYYCLDLYFILYFRYFVITFVTWISLNRLCFACCIIADKVDSIISQYPELSSIPSIVEGEDDTVKQLVTFATGYSVGWYYDIRCDREKAVDWMSPYSLFDDGEAANWTHEKVMKVYPENSCSENHRAELAYTNKLFKNYFLTNQSHQPEFYKEYFTAFKVKMIDKQHPQFLEFQKVWQERYISQLNNLLSDNRVMRYELEKIAFKETGRGFGDYFVNNFMIGGNRLCVLDPTSIINTKDDKFYGHNWAKLLETEFTGLKDYYEVCTSNESSDWFTFKSFCEKYPQYNYSLRHRLISVMDRHLVAFRKEIFHLLNSTYFNSLYDLRNQGAFQDWLVNEYTQRKESFMNKLVKDYLLISAPEFPLDKLQLLTNHFDTLFTKNAINLNIQLYKVLEWHCVNFFSREIISDESSPLYKEFACSKFDKLQRISHYMNNHFGDRYVPIFNTRSVLNEPHMVDLCAKLTLHNYEKTEADSRLMTFRNDIVNKIYTMRPSIHTTPNPLAGEPYYRRTDNAPYQPPILNRVEYTAQLTRNDKFSWFNPSSLSQNNNDISATNAEESYSVKKKKRVEWKEDC